MVSNLTIRNVRKDDYNFILNLNMENVDFLSPLNRDRLSKLIELSTLSYVIEVNNFRVGFLIAFDQNAKEYDSENYKWFLKHYDKFLYIDRVVIDTPYRRMGVGKAIYEKIFEYAKEKEIKYVTCEVDIVPYNEASLKYHSFMGFKEVGKQTIRNGLVEVCLQAIKIR